MAEIHKPVFLLPFLLLSFLSRSLRFLITILVHHIQRHRGIVSPIKRVAYDFRSSFLMNSPIRSSVFLGDTAHQSLPLVFLPRLQDNRIRERRRKSFVAFWFYISTRSYLCCVETEWWSSNVFHIQFLERLRWLKLFQKNLPEIETAGVKSAAPLFFDSRARME